MATAGKECFLLWAPLVGYISSIFLMSSLSSFPVHLPVSWPIDKVLHFVEYAVLSLLVARVVHRSLGRLASVVKIAVITIGITILFGVGDELFQSKVVNRDCSVFDLAADALGGSGGFLMYYLLLRKTRCPQTDKS